MPRVSECHPDRVHQAHGLCTQCYQRQYQRERWRRLHKKEPSEYAPNFRKFTKRPPARVNECGHPERRHYSVGLCASCYKHKNLNRRRAECHPERPYVADGLCNACYNLRAYHADPARHKEQAKRSGLRTRKRNRDELIQAYGGRCACANCPETNAAFLTLEHVGLTGKEHRAKVGSHVYADLRRRGFPKEGFTLLCWNCNALTRFGAPCPHEEG